MRESGWGEDNRMIFLLIEQAMNSTVPIEIIVTGIEADSFDAAFEKLTHFENWHLAENFNRNDERINYVIPGENPVFGTMRTEPLKIR